MAVNFLVNLTVFAAIGVAGVQWLCSKRFRHLYDPQPRPDLARLPAGASHG
ncbi:glycosyltransferase family 2 protein [Streptomyces tanashiensis]